MATNDTHRQLAELLKRASDWKDDQEVLIEHEERFAAGDAPVPPDPDDWSASDDEAAEIVRELATVLIADPDIRNIANRKEG